MRLASKSKIINILDAEHQAKWDHVPKGWIGLDGTAKNGQLAHM